MALERLGLLMGPAPFSGGQHLDDGHHVGKYRRYDVFHLLNLHEVVPNQFMGHILQCHSASRRLTGALALVRLSVLAI